MSDTQEQQAVDMSAYTINEADGIELPPVERYYPDEETRSLRARLEASEKRVRELEAELQGIKDGLQSWANHLAKP